MLLEPGPIVGDIQWHLPYKFNLSTRPRNKRSKIQEKFSGLIMNSYKKYKPNRSKYDTYAYFGVTDEYLRRKY